MGVLEDVSVGGLRLFVTHRHERAEVLGAELGRPPGFPARRLGVRVAWCGPAPGGGYLLGCCLVNPLSEEETRALAGAGAG